MAITSTKNLHDSSRNKNDEFYTTEKDIEAELKYYHRHLNGKVVYCNCDRSDSEFVRYFSYNFEALGLKDLLYTSDDFRHGHNIKKLQSADVIITNPPFSLFREYMKTLMDHKKRFLIIGNQNALTYKDIFPLIMENKVWLGCTPEKGNLIFRVPDDYTATSHRLTKDENGVKWMSLDNVIWITNLEHTKRRKDLHLTRKYNPIAYPRYDNFDAIEVGKYKDIPRDYEGKMGVPITFLKRYNPKQFEILGLSRYLSREQGGGDFCLNGKLVYMRVVIRRRAA